MKFLASLTLAAATLDLQVAARWGLNPSVVVAGGGGNNAVSAIGVGA